ncbi:MAG: ribonuclease HI family protein [Candidatus Eisenbacteria bacterium]|nr:ribonuclease HI family protein [Candidatus Eisenbacteria bacterium]
MVLYTDGASKGNPGPSGAGGVIMTGDGTVLEEFHVHLGSVTNNVAEYEAVRIGLSRALAHGARRLVVRLDSELVANQLSGRFKVKDRKLIDQYLKVGELLSQLDSVRFEAIPREENTRADMLAQAGARSGP